MPLEIYATCLHCHQSKLRSAFPIRKEQRGGRQLVTHFVICSDCLANQPELWAEWMLPESEPNDEKDGGP